MTQQELAFVKYAMRGIRGRYCEDVAAEGRLALVVAHQAGKRGIDLLRAVENGVFIAARRERIYDSRISFTAPRAIVATSNRQQNPYLGLWGAIRTLSGQQRTAVELVYFCELTQEEAAEVMGLDRTAVTHLIERALKKMSKSLAKRHKTHS